MPSVIAVANDPGLLVAIASALATLAAIAGFALPYLRRDRLQDRLRAATKRRQELRARQLEALGRRATLRLRRRSRVRALLDALDLEVGRIGTARRQQLARAGWRDPNAGATFLAARLATPAAFALAAAWFLYGVAQHGPGDAGKALLVLAAAAAGFFLPGLLLLNAVQRRQAAFSRAFPDAMDLLLICVESGLSVEAGFGRVTQEVGGSAPELADEFDLTTAELAYLPDRRVALENLAARTGLPNVRALATTLIQAEKYGTPTGAALQVAAQESREARMAAAEKKASALPAQLTVPMILFFLPGLFVVILGPAVIQFMRM